MKKTIDSRLKILNMITLVTVVLLITISAVASMNGMKSLADILDHNDKVRNLCNGIDKEEKAFDAYLNSEQPEAYATLLEAAAITEDALKKLPNQYYEMTLEQYAQTNSIKRTYVEYKQMRQDIVEMDSGENQYTSFVTRCYMIQNYLKNYAGKLQTITMEQSSVRYQKLKVMFVLIPGICIVTGSLVLFIFMWFKHYATKNYINTMEEKHQIEKQLVETRYQMLKNQINPHFLFNTLNLIASTAEIEDASTTEKMIVTLSRLFRYNLKSQTTVMPLEQELKVAEDYMYLQRMRFGIRIKYISFPEEDTLQTLVPSFVLQPLVENAVIHGLSKLSRGGVIVVRTWKHNGLMWISVADTGAGMSQQIYEQLKMKLENDTGKPENESEYDADEKGTGIALVNIMERIRGMYEQSGVRLYSKINHGTVIQLYFGEGNNDV